MGSITKGRDDIDTTKFRWKIVDNDVDDSGLLEYRASFNECKGSEIHDMDALLPHVLMVEEAEKESNEVPPQYKNN